MNELSRMRCTVTYATTEWAVTLSLVCFFFCLIVVLRIDVYKKFYSPITKHVLHTPCYSFQILKMRKLNSFPIDILFNAPLVWPLIVGKRAQPAPRLHISFCFCCSFEFLYFALLIVSSLLPSISISSSLEFILAIRSIFPQKIGLWS